MSFIAKLEKVGFATLGKQEAQDRDLGLCYSLFNSWPWFSNENGVVITRTVTLAPQAPAPFLLLTPTRVCGDFDIHRCRSPLQGTGQASPGYITTSSAIRKDPQI